MEERVQEALQGLHTVASVVTITSQPTGTKEEVTIPPLLGIYICRCVGWLLVHVGIAL